MSKGISINIDRIIIQLLCWYALLIPLEHILEVLFQIETILKPYRVLAILIIGCFVVRLRFKWTANPELGQDIFLYIIFIYGLIVTLLRMITSTFNLALFFNDAFQISLYLGVFVVIRHISITRSDLLRITKFLAGGVLINSSFIFYNFFTLRVYGRDPGFMDNPNYMALSILVVILLLIVQYPSINGLLKKVLVLAMMLFLGYIFMLAGSRTALAVLVACIIIMLCFSHMKVKVALITMSIVLISFLSFGGLGLLQESGNLALINRLQTKSASEDNRISIWRGVLKAAETTSYTGLGVGQFKARFREFYISENNQEISRMRERGYFISPHSDYLAFLAIYGIVGLGSYLIFLSLSLKKVFFKYQQSVDNDTRQHYQFGFLILIAVVFFGLANENVISALFWILLAISTRVETSETEILDEQNSLKKHE